MGLKQISLAIVTLLIVITLTLSIMLLVDEDFMGSWLALFFIICVPVQVAISALFEADKTIKLNGLPQPINGVIILLICITLGGIFTYLAFISVGGAIELPRPPLLSYSIIAVVVSFWYVIVWQCWPISKMTKNPVLIACSVFVVSFGLAYLILIHLFSFEFMAANEIYIESLDPKGLFASWSITAFLVTTVAMIFSLVLFDFWPAQLLTSPQNPFLWGIVNSIFIMSGASLFFAVAIIWLQLDPVYYLVNGPISYIFGMFIPLNLFSGQLWLKQAQPIRGTMLIVVSIISGVVLNRLYFAMADYVNPEMVGGAPSYQLELWIANAMLAFSFPLLVAFTEHFKFWPIAAMLSVDKCEESS